MNTILVEVYVPAAGKTYDMFVPKHLFLHQVLALVEKMVKDLTGEMFLPNQDTTLCSRKDGAILNLNLTVYELGLKNGSKLMLV